MTLLKILTQKIHLTFNRFLRYFNNKRLRTNILTFYTKIPTEDKDINQALGYIKNNGIHVFPYPFIDKYNAGNIILEKDEINGLYYIIRNKKKLYFRNNITYKTACNIYNSLLIEQDPESPHRYLTEDFDITENDILVDIGCAEAFLALDVVDKVKKIYLFEYEDAWIEALQHTFAPWKEKVEIIKNYVSDHTDNECITIDEFFEHIENKPTFIKIDVEGAEKQVLKGTKNTIHSTDNIKLAICTYHRQNDYQEITSYISNIGFDYETSSNYMLCNIKPYFRRGLVRAKKK